MVHESWFMNHGVWFMVYRVSSSLLGLVVPSVRALSGRLKFSVRRHKFKKDNLVHDAWCLVSDRATAERVQGAGCRVHGSWFRVSGAGFRVQGSCIRVQGSGLRVEG